MKLTLSETFGMCGVSNCLFCYRQWRHVGQALHADWESREHWVSLSSPLWQIYWKLDRALGKCALLLWHRGHELRSLFTLSLNQSLNHLNTPFTFDKECDTAKCFCVGSVTVAINVCFGPRSTPHQTGQEAFEWDCGAVSIWSRLPLWDGRQWCHPTDPHPC